MRRRGAATALLVLAIAAAISPSGAAGHAGVVASDPAAGAELGATPTRVSLTFTEEPAASLSQIQVLDAQGRERQTARPQAVSGDPLTLTVPVSRLGRGVYTVQYRTVSAVDGHATGGAFAFGVRAPPAGGGAVTTTSSPDVSALEVVARWVLLVGLVAMIGAAVAGAARFGGSSGSDLRLAIGGWATADAGLVLLALAQRRTSGSSLGDLLQTSVGEALVWRAVALAIAGVALFVAAQRPAIRRGALGACAGAGLGVVIAHVGAGHAAAGDWPDGLTVGVQVAHFAAAAVWFGGLAALLLGVRGAPSAEGARAVRRFSVVAAGALVLVLVTGTVRAVDELGSWDDLFDTGYGRAVVAKVALIALVFAVAAYNRRRSVPAAASDLRPLQRAGGAELVLATGALAVAALLGTLAPPVAGQQVAGPALSDTGADYATTVSVTLSAGSDQPGPNRFVVDLRDYDTGEPASADLVSLRFVPLDDPGVAPTSLSLRPGDDGTWAGSGPNLVFDGRWGVTVLVERGPDSVEVPLELDLPFHSEAPSIVRLPGKPPQYTLPVEFGEIRIEPDPEREGPSTIHVSLFGAFDLVAPSAEVVVTGTPGDGPTEQLPVERVSRSRFDARADLPAGPYRVSVVAHRDDGARMRGSVELQVPPG